MGRSITTSSAPKTTVLSTTLGNTGTNTKDTVSRVTTVSVDGITFQGNTNNSRQFSNGSLSAQRIRGDGSSSGILIDPLTDHSAYIYYNLSPNYTAIGVLNGQTPVYAANLTSVTTGTVFCIRLYNGVLYYFSSNGSGLYVRKVVLATRAVSTVTVASGNFSSSTSTGLVYNHLANNKFWIYTNNGSSNFVFTYDITTDTAATFNSSSADFSTTSFGMVVDSTGTSVAVATYSDSAGASGVKTITSSSWTFTSGPSGYHYQGWTSGQNVGFQSNSYVFPGVIVFRGSLNINYNAYYYDTYVPHLAATDTAVRVYQPPSGNPYTVPFEMLEPHSAIAPSATQCQIGSTYATYTVSRNGNNLVFTQVGTAYQSNFALTRLPATTIVNIYVQGEYSGSNAYISNIYVYTPQQNYTWTYTSQISFHNLLSNYTGLSHKFVDSTGAIVGISFYRSSGSQDANAFYSQLPLYTPERSGTYKVTVIGGGGAGTNSSPVHGSSSTFNGVAAAAGQNRLGFNSGGIIVTSGTTAGLAGRGYGADSWGEGEPPHGSGNWGGGSGFVVSSNMTLSAGTPYLYTVGFGPQYGKQGAVIIETT